MPEFQYGLLNTAEENIKLAKDHDLQISFLPVSPFQEKFVGEVELSARELEIMHLTLSGVEIHDIAAKIHLSSHGVKYRLSSVYWKFNVKNRLQLIKKATTSGLQFRTDSGVKHTFFMPINLMAVNKTESDKTNE
jgi:DNA-binding NarL/FixJ family response regulator